MLSGIWTGRTVTRYWIVWVSLILEPPSTSHEHDGPWLMALLRLCVADFADHGEDLQDAASDVGWHGHQQEETLPTRSLCGHWALK